MQFDKKNENKKKLKINFQNKSKVDKDITRGIFIQLF